MRRTYLGLDRWNLGRFTTGFAGMGFTAAAIWNHDLVLILSGLSLGGVSQFLNLVRHSKNGVQNGHDQV